MSKVSRAASAALVVAVTGAFLMPAFAADPDRGERVFKGECGSCHSAAQGKRLVGPSLFGVLGRKAGYDPGFRYSPANKASAVTWDATTLDRYLQAPDDVVPGTIMLYRGVKDDTRRADLIAYLGTLK